MATSGSWNVDCTTGLYGNDSGARFQLQFSWSQSYTKGGSSSTISVSAKLVCTTYKYAVNASWYKNGQGNITIAAGGNTIGSWGSSAQLTTTALTSQNQVLWSGSTSFTLNTTAASSFVISITGGLFVNTGSNSNSITFPTISSTQYTDAVPQYAYYTVSISQGTGTSLTVKNGSTTLSNGASVREGTTLTASYSVNTGYTSGSMTVNGTAQSSGYSWQIYSNSTVSSSASLIYFSLSKSQGTGTTLTVQNGSTALSNGAGVAYGTTLKATVSANTGYTSAWMNVNGIAQSSGYSWTVTSTPSVSSGASLITYTVSYNANGGSGAPGAQTKTYGQNLTLSSTRPSWAGRTFLGWATSASGSVVYQPGGTYSANASVTLYAIWSLNSYTVTISQGTGTTLTVTNGSTAISSGASVSYGTTLMATFSTNTGYKSGWMTVGGTGQSSGYSWTVTGDITVSSGATAKTYTVSYNANGGSGSMTSSTATWGQSFITRQNAFTRTGHAFNGWNEQADGTGTAWTLTSLGVYESGKSRIWSYDQDITLYAQWVVTIPMYQMYIDDGSKWHEVWPFIDVGSEWSGY